MIEDNNKGVAYPERELRVVYCYIKIKYLRLQTVHCGLVESLIYLWSTKPQCLFEINKFLVNASNGKQF